MNEQKILGRTQMVMNIGSHRRQSAKRRAQEVAAKGWTPAAEAPADPSTLSRQQRRLIARRAAKDGRS